MTIEARFHLSRGGFQLKAELSIPGRGITALFGPSGCGKTTLLRAIAGLERSSGSFLKISDSIWQDDNCFLPPWQRPLGYVFQEASLFPHLNIQRNLEYGMSRVPAAERRVAFSQAVELLGISQLLDRDPAGLSGGERQRVAIARALLTSPRLLLMDEPLAALDLNSKTEILPFLERLHEELEIPVIYVSHSPKEVARLADHLVLMERGRTRASGPIAEMLTRPDLPLSKGDLAAAVIEAEICGHEPEFHLTHLRFSGGEFTIVEKTPESGGHLRLRILARDVSLTLEPQSGTSILNIFSARVIAVTEEDTARVMVSLDIGGTTILSRITRKSAVALQLKPGTRVQAQVKSIAVL